MPWQYLSKYLSVHSMCPCGLECYGNGQFENMGTEIELNNYLAYFIQKSRLLIWENLKATAPLCLLYVRLNGK